MYDVIIVGGGAAVALAQDLERGRGAVRRWSAALGCSMNEKGTVRTSLAQATGIPGLYVAGDAARDVQFVVVAAAEGAKAAVAINSLKALKH